MSLHRSTCPWVEKMSYFHKVEFSSKEAGLAAGYDGCYYCLRAASHKMREGNFPQSPFLLYFLTPRDSPVFTYRCFPWYVLSTPFCRHASRKNSISLISPFSSQKASSLFHFNCTRHVQIIFLIGRKISLIHPILLKRKIHFLLKETVIIDGIRVYRKRTGNNREL